MVNEIHKQKSETQERRTVKDCIMNLWMLEGKSFEHKFDGRIYTVAREEGLDNRKIVTTEGVRIPLENCFNDLEATPKQLAKLKGKRFY